MKLFLAGTALIGLGVIVYFFIMFIGPHMTVQEHIRAYQRIMPLPPEGIVLVEPDPYAVPDLKKASGMKNPESDDEASRDQGRTYYNYYCVFCHGENGQGDGPVGYSYMPAPTDLHDPKVAKMSDGELMRAMLLGIGHEPVLPRIVHPGHRWHLVNYIRELGKSPRMPAENYGSRVILRGPEPR